MGSMDEREAREVKAQVSDYVRELAQRRVQVQDMHAAAVPLALGLAPLADGGYGVAVRYRLGFPAVRSIARKVAEQVGPAADVRRTGRIRTLAGPGGGPSITLRPPVVTARSLGETGRVRPLRPGVSIAHAKVSAGTLGAFVVVDGRMHALSNYHVLSGTPSARMGDPVLQPGPADGGRTSRDKVGELAGRVELEPHGRATVDCAVALLDDPEVDLRYPVGLVTTTAPAVGNEQVAKIGRTTSVTHGKVTAIELDDVVVGYGEELGEIAFDGQIEVESTGASAFSRGGDSGSLVYREDGVALGLLFAGSETGGENGSGLTYLNPIDAVLDALGATLAT
ncbi:S1 family peptidase [Cellulomonas algicola]|uniref:S1 family peptidase n=1 Tax=Cellulomonas algicola TaxID=2071633 RepID=UPI001CEDD828|nr:S1 family peptidase [Cellulomonas algicola]